MERSKCIMKIEQAVSADTTAASSAKDETDDIFSCIDFGQTEDPAMTIYSAESLDNDKQSSWQSPSASSANTVASTFLFEWTAWFAFFLGSFSCPTKTIIPRPLEANARVVNEVNARVVNPTPKRRIPRRVHVCQHPACGKGFTRKFNLQIHEQTHDPNRKRPFACPFPQCSKSFARSRDLARHKLIHTAINSWMCCGCEKTYLRKDALIRHQRMTPCENLQYRPP